MKSASINEPNTKMLFGDAKNVLQKLVAEFKKGAAIARITSTTD